jgi:hypothetical protein
LKEIENNKLIALDKFKILRMNMQLSNLFPDLSKIIQSNFKIVKQILQKISRKVTKKLKMSLTVRLSQKKLYLMIHTMQLIIQVTRIIPYKSLI